MTIKVARDQSQEAVEIAIRYNQPTTGTISRPLVSKHHLDTARSFFRQTQNRSPAAHGKPCGTQERDEAIQTQDQGGSPICQRMPPAQGRVLGAAHYVAAAVRNPVACQSQSCHECPSQCEPSFISGGIHARFHR